MVGAWKKFQEPYSAVTMLDFYFPVTFEVHFENNLSLNGVKSRKKIKKTFECKKPMIKNNLRKFQSDNSEKN